MGISTIKPFQPIAPLPSYNKPPVNEVVCGMRYNTPEQLKIPHLGILWDKIRAEYPVIQHAPPIASIQGELYIDEITGAPIPRVWLINKTDDQLIQLQFDRFYYNWRRKEGEYPHYPFIIEKFDNVLNSVDALFRDYNLGELSPSEYELSYINHIPKGAGWDTFEDLHKVFNDFVWSRQAARFLPNPSAVNWTAEFPMPDKMGRLFVYLKHGIRKDDKTQLLIMEVVARGKVEAKDKKDYRKWFDVAHEWIVKGFTDLTTPAMHKYWERIK